MTLSFRRFIEEDLYSAASKELNTQGEVGVQVFNWVLCPDGIYRFGQSFEVVKKDDNDDESSPVWVKPIVGKVGKDDEKAPYLKLNVIKCARKDEKGNFIQIDSKKCPPMKPDEFPIDRKIWTKLVNEPFAQAGAGSGGAAPGQLPGMM